MPPVAEMLTVEVPPLQRIGVDVDEAALLSDLTFNPDFQLLSIKIPSFQIELQDLFFLLLRVDFLCLM